MNGNWCGPYNGTNSGRMVVEVDDCGDHFEGFIYAFDDNTALPSISAYLKTSDKSNEFTAKLSLFPLNGASCEEMSAKAIEILISEGNVNVPKEAEVDIQWNDKTISINWKTEIGTQGSAELSRKNCDEPSSLIPLPISSWNEFKDYVCEIENHRYIFRGQITRRLQTPFHRTGRGDMRRFFFQEDVPTLHRHVSALTDHVFDLANGYQNAAFLNLVQHHGYPTPLLDWTYSPFVGAYFAYHRIKKAEADAASDEEKVRIFIFDKRQWCLDINQVLSVTVRWPHFSIVEPIALNNKRLIPQQALSSYTTVDDIEGYIRSRESPEKQYLRVIDLPVKQRDRVLRELSLMGVTAGSLFPGLDGACEELKHRFFRL